MFDLDPTVVQEVLQAQAHSLVYTNKTMQTGVGVRVILLVLLTYKHSRSYVQ